MLALLEELDGLLLSIMLKAEENKVANNRNSGWPTYHVNKVVNKYYDDILRATFLVCLEQCVF